MPSGRCPRQGRRAHALTVARREEAGAWLPLVERRTRSSPTGRCIRAQGGLHLSRLSLVPQSCATTGRSPTPHYIPGQFVYQFDKSIRAISRPQTEIMAARFGAARVRVLNIAHSYMLRESMQTSASRWMCGR